MSQRSSTLSRGLGGAVRRIREERGLTQAELAQAVGVGAIQISRIERGVQEPRFVTIQRLAHALEINPAALWTFAAEAWSEGNDQSNVSEVRPCYPELRGSQNRRLLALVRQLERLDPELAEVALDASITLTRELAKKLGGGRRR